MLAAPVNPGPPDRPEVTRIDCEGVFPEDLGAFPTELAAQCRIPDHLVASALRRQEACASQKAGEKPRPSPFPCIDG